MPQEESRNLEELSAGEAVEQLGANLAQGLSNEEVRERRERYGDNAIEEEKRHPLLKLAGHFWGPIPWMLEAAVILSAAAQRWEDFAVIFVMLLINGGVGFWHENKADKAIEALKEQLAPEAHVRRDGQVKTINSEELVLGDVVELRLGDVVPADVKLVSESDISLDESTLTGESLPVTKGKDSEAYSGTSVKQGTATAVVTATGGDTRFAQTVNLVESAEATTHFRRAVMRIGYFLIGMTAVLVGLIVAVGLLRGEETMQLLLFAMVLTIAGIPQALPAVLTVTMTVGAKKLAKLKAIVSQLASLEEMAGLEILCADKTGTLTKNELELQDPAPIEAGDKDDLVRSAVLTCDRDAGDPIDRAVLDTMDYEEALGGGEVTDFIPFDPDRKRASATMTQGGSRFTVTKGAPQVIMDVVQPSDEIRQKVNDTVADFGEQGYRSLGVGRQDEDGQWHYLGVLPLLDPPRDDSGQVIKDAQSHNIDVRMVTGDHSAIARQVAGQVGMGTNIKSAKELFGEDGACSEARVREVEGFSEVTPGHKFQIVKALQAHDHIIGMTGDGVNDAPALKQANVGVAVSSATDAARMAADLVLTAPGLGVITRAVEVARQIFERMTSYAIFRITETVRVLLFMTACMLVYNLYPVTPVMIVLLAILNDIPIMTIAVDNTPTPKRPVRWDMKRVLGIASLLAVGGVISSFVLFWFVRNYAELTTAQIQTVIFLKLLVAGHMTIFLTRNMGWLWDKPWPDWRLFAALEGTQIAGTLAAVYGILVEPIGWGPALAVWGYASVSLLILNTLKVLFVRWLGLAAPESGVETQAA